jgi:hypothetical protein
LEKITSVDTPTGQIWYPQEGTLTFHRKHGTIKNRFDCHELRVNIETNKDTWKFPFPVGTEVIDHIRDITYVIGSTDHSNRQDMSKKSTELNKTEDQTERKTKETIAVIDTGGKHFGFVVVLCLSALLVCGGGIFLWKRNADRMIEKAKQEQSNS